MNRLRSFPDSLSTPHLGDNPPATVLLELDKTT
jgi:hypothetical protein